jgi:hypothetical protein
MTTPPVAPPKQNPAGAVVALLVIGGLVWFFFFGGLEQQVTSNLNDIHQQVATDAVTQYNIAKRSGTPMDACVHAGIVAAGYLQAKNEAAYQQWKALEKADCRIAGLDR